MADTSITPYGYIYGKDPKANHPFWGGSGPDIEEYVKSLNGTVTETEDGKLYTINATDGDDVVTKVIDILVPNVEMPEIPTDYVTSVAIQKVEAANQDTYSFTYYTKDGESHGMGTIVVKKDYVSSVDVTGEESGGVNTVTIDVDGDESSFDVPTQYIKSADVTISNGGRYTDLSVGGVDGSSTASSRIMRIAMTPAVDHPDNLNEIEISNEAGDTSRLQWAEGGINQILGKVDGFINIRWPQTNKRYVGIMANVYSTWNEVEAYGGIFEAHAVFPKPSLSNYTTIIIPAKWFIDSTVENYITKNSGYENDTITATTHYDAYIRISWPVGNDAPIVGGVLLKPCIVLNNTTKNIKEVIQCEPFTVTNYMSNTLNLGVVS